MTFSRLTLGEPRLKSNLRGGSVAAADPCSEDLVYGTNVLRDPGFELHSTAVDRGPATDDWPDGLTFPGDGYAIGGTPGTLRWITVDGITDLQYYDVNGWAVWSNNVGVFGTDPSPYISDANPRSGTYHWRVSYMEEGDWGGADTYPIAVGGRYCGTTEDIQPYSARCSEGDYIYASCYAMVNNTTDGPFEAFPAVGFFDENASSVGSEVFREYSSITLGSWTLLWVDAVAPAGAYTVVVEYEVLVNVFVSSPPLHLDIDDCVLEIQP